MGHFVTNHFVTFSYNYLYRHFYFGVFVFLSLMILIVQKMKSFWIHQVIWIWPLFFFLMFLLYYALISPNFIGYLKLRRDFFRFFIKFHKGPNWRNFFLKRVLLIIIPVHIVIGLFGHIYLPLRSQCIFIIKLSSFQHWD